MFEVYILDECYSIVQPTETYFLFILKSEYTSTWSFTWRLSNFRNYKINFCVGFEVIWKQNHKKRGNLVLKQSEDPKNIKITN